MYQAAKLEYDPAVELEIPKHPAGRLRKAQPKLRRGLIRAVANPTHLALAGSFATAALLFGSWWPLLFGFMACAIFTTITIFESGPVANARSRELESAPGRARWGEGSRAAEPCLHVHNRT